MNKGQLFEEIDGIYSEWHGGGLHIGIERTERIKEALNRAINFIPCCMELNTDEKEQLFNKGFSQGYNNATNDILNSI